MATHTSTHRSDSQKKHIRFTVISIVLVILAFLGLFLNKVLTPRVLSQEELRQHGVVIFDQPRLLRPFDLLDQDSGAVSKSDLENKLSLVFFGFTFCPDICPGTLAELSRVYEKLDANDKEQVQIIMVTLDPERDTPAQLKPYIEYFDKDFKAWTGEFPALMGLSRNVNIAFTKVPLDKNGGATNNYTIDHSSQVVILNRHGDYAGYIRAPLPTEALPRILESTLLRVLD